MPCIENTKEYMYLNPGSISDPREGNPNTYMIYENKEFIIPLRFPSDIFHNLSSIMAVQVSQAALCQ